MENKFSRLIPTKPFDGICGFLRRCLFQVLCIGPMPNHIAFILDGNRRYGRKRNMEEGEAHRIGLSNLMWTIRYCYEMGVKYVTAFGFSIDNFKRKPATVQFLMDLIREKIEALLDDMSTVNGLGVRIEFIGNLELLDESIQEGAKKLMAMTTRNTRLVLLVCIAYASSDEIIHGIQGSCKEKWARYGQSKAGIQQEEDVENGSISLVDLERRMYLAAHPDPDLLVRTSGETRLSDFLLWQTTFCLLHAPSCLWPEFSVVHLVWAILEYQRNHGYLEKIKKQM